VPDGGGDGRVLRGHFHHFPEFCRINRLETLGVLLPVVIRNFVPGDSVAKCPKLLFRVPLKLVQAGGDGLQDFLQSVFGGVIGDAAEHKNPQIRLNAAEDLFRQPDAFGQSCRKAVGAHVFNEVVHRCAKAKGWRPCVANDFDKIPGF